MISFSEEHSKAVYDVNKRQQKAKKILAVLDDYYSGNLKDLSLLDLGCSAGIILKALSERFAIVTGIDIDRRAIEYAKSNYASSNLEFRIGDGIDLDFADESFDVVVCSHIYEHVSDARKLLSEIERVLKPEGICYLACGNRLSLIEPHYRLLFLSVIPKPFAHLYLRILKKGDIYHENHLTLWGLKRLVSRFNVIDCTLNIIKDPDRYCATEMVKQDSFKQKMAICMAKVAYSLLPTYIWLLHKKEG